MCCTSPRWQVTFSRKNGTGLPESWSQWSCSEIEQFTQDLLKCGEVKWNQIEIFKWGIWMFFSFFKLSSLLKEFRQETWLTVPDTTGSNSLGSEYPHLVCSAWNCYVVLPDEWNARPLENTVILWIRGDHFFFSLLSPQGERATEEHIRRHQRCQEDCRGRIKNGQARTHHRWQCKSSCSFLKVGRKTLTYAHSIISVCWLVWSSYFPAAQLTRAINILA